MIECESYNNWIHSLELGLTYRNQSILFTVFFVLEQPHLYQENQIATRRIAGGGNDLFAPLSLASY